MDASHFHTGECNNSLFLYKEFSAVTTQGKVTSSVNAKWQESSQTCRQIFCVLVTATNKNSIATPWKINMEHNHRGLEDHFPFFLGDLYVPC